MSQRDELGLIQSQRREIVILDLPRVVARHHSRIEADQGEW
jgi:hypothetical protein